MTAPSYTTDISGSNTLSTCDAVGTWLESSDAAWDDGVDPSAEGDFYIQGSACMGQALKTGTGSAIFDNVSGVTFNTGDVFLIWMYCVGPNAMASYANGGFRVIIGDGYGSFYGWDVGGSDTLPYGGWQIYAVDPTVTPDDTVGGYTGTTKDHFGGAAYLTGAINKGSTFGVDVIRHGRAKSIFEFGDLSNGYCTFAGFNTQDENSSNRWGLLIAEGAGYTWQGLMSLGTTTNAVDFRDSNVNISIRDQKKVTTSFNKIEVHNASSNIEWTNIQFTAIKDGAGAIGSWENIANATLVKTNCQFTDMGTFNYGSNTTADGCTYRRCLQVDPEGGDLSNSTIEESAVTGGGSAGGGALLWNDSGNPNTKTDGMTFSKGAGSHHAIEFGTSAPTSITLTDCTFTGFSTSDQQTTSVLYFPDTGGDVTWNVSHTGTSGVISYYKARSGDTVNVTSTVTLTVTCKNQAGSPLEGVNVRIETDPAGVKIADGSTNASGVFTDSTYNYVSDTNVKIITRIKGKQNNSAFDTIKSTGLSVPFTMVADKSVNLP